MLGVPLNYKMVFTDSLASHWTTWGSSNPYYSLMILYCTLWDLYGPPRPYLWTLWVLEPPHKNLYIRLTIVELKSRSVWNNTVFYDGMRIIKISCVKMNQAFLTSFCFSQQTMARDVIGKSLELKTSVWIVTDIWRNQEQFWLIFHLNTVEAA